MSTTVTYHKPNRVTIHCCDTSNGKPVSIEAITKDHIKRGFSTIGYHAVIQPDGTIENGRPLNVVGAHVEGANTGNLGIALAGRDLFTKAQFEALRLRLTYIRHSFGIQSWDVYTHSQFKSATDQQKTCPNISINNLLAWLLTGDISAIRMYLYDSKSS